MDLEMSLLEHSTCKKKVERVKSAAAYPIYTQTRVKLAVHHVCVVRRSKGWDDHYDGGAG